VPDQDKIAAEKQRLEESKTQSIEVPAFRTPHPNGPNLEELKGLMGHEDEMSTSDSMGRQGSEQVSDCDSLEAVPGSIQNGTRQDSMAEWIANNEEETFDGGRIALRKACFWGFWFLASRRKSI
jgi:hypothetical protein